MVRGMVVFVFGGNKRVSFWGEGRRVGSKDWRAGLYNRIKVLGVFIFGKHLQRNKVNDRG